MGMFWVDIEGTRADGTPDFFKGRISASSEVEAEQEALDKTGIVDITSRTIEPY